MTVFLAVRAYANAETAIIAVALPFERDDPAE
jgi:hypothetical protein